MSDISTSQVWVTADDLTRTTILTGRQRNRRGVNVFTLSDLLSMSGETRDGQTITGTVQQNLFTLSIDERIQIYRKNHVVFGLVTGRAKRIAGRDWIVKRESKEDDRVEAKVKMAAELFKEYDDPQSVTDLTVRQRCLVFIRQWLKDVKPDLSNVTASLQRWKRLNKMRYEDRSTEIEDWMHQLNGEDSFRDFVMKTEVDHLTHGAWSWYKSRLPENNLIDQVYLLPGGTVLPFRQMFVGGAHGYFQILTGTNPKIYFDDEITYGRYAPNSGLSYGAVPLEALVNMIAETLLFEEQAAMKADGTSAPEKMVVFNESFPFGDEDVGKDLTMPITREEQSRLETLFNEPRRNAIRILSGYGGAGQPTVVDLSRESTFAAQSDRTTDKVPRAIAVCFNASNMEINLTGSEDTSGRETSEQQSEVDRATGWMPDAMAIEDKFNTDILPQKFGPDYRLECDKGLNEREQIELDSARLRSGSYAINEIRMDRGDDPFPGQQYDLPPGSGDQSQQPPDGSEGRPLNVQMSKSDRRRKYW